MRTRNTITITLVLFAGAPPAAPAAERGFHVQTATRPAGLDGPALNLLTWPRPQPAAGGSPYEICNLYRKIDARAPYPLAPLNATPLRIYTNCERIRALIPEGSEDWQLVRQALAGAERIPKSLTPCALGSLGTGRDAAAAVARLEILARSRWRVAVLLGLGYADTQVTPGKEYFYELRGIDSRGAEVVLATNIKIRAGLFSPVAPPEDVQAIAGDRRVLVHWKENRTASGFEVLRASSLNGTYEVLNVAPITGLVTRDFDDQPLDPAGGDRNGYVDAQEWDAAGNPTLKHVSGFMFIPTGPVNGKTFYYKVASLDLLGFAGASSSPVAVVPEDKTPPAVPAEVAVIPDDAAGKIQIRWVRATRDADGHPEGPVAGYRVYRKEDPQAAAEVKISGDQLVPQPPFGTAFVTFDDPDPALRPPYGEKTFWYQVDCVDAEGNVSSRSAPVSGHLRDITPPAPPAGVIAKGFEDRIRIEWALNHEPDIDGYEIFRSLCDGGDWPCAGYSPAEMGRCQTPFGPLGYVSHQDALAGGAFFEDLTVPPGSPLCYAYLVKALDEAQNRSGTMPPDATKETIVCQRLHDLTPPEPAVITGLQARDDAILVEWLGPPVQDVHAYHVYRAEAKDGPWTFAGGMTVAIPPAVPQLLNTPYQAPGLAVCDQIRMKANQAHSIGSFLDHRAAAHKVYWYKVLGIDWDGNEATGGVPASTFTFSSGGPGTPAIGTVAAQNQPSGLALAWTPAFDNTKHRGFALFRSTSAAGPFRQVGTLLTSSQHVDREVIRGVTYYYKVALLGLDGTVSIPSVVKSGTVN
jgi:hypothetical protein